MKQVSTLFLKITVVIFGILVLLLCLLLLPRSGMTAFSAIQDGLTLGYIVLGILLAVYLSAIPFYLALYQTLKLLTYIEKSLAFSELSVIALKKIKNYAKIISGLYVIVLPLLYLVAEWDDAPGLTLIGLIISGASFVIAVFASVLQRLLQEAITIKEENDLTV